MKIDDTVQVRQIPNEDIYLHWFNMDCFDTLNTYTITLIQMFHDGLFIKLRGHAYWHKAIFFERVKTVGFNINMDDC